MREKLLFWLEALSILNAVNVAARALSLLHQKLGTRSGQPDSDVENIVGLIKDSVKFTRYFAPVMTRSAPHIYISALPFTPVSSAVATVYRLMFRKGISVSVGKLLEWPTEQLVIRGHDSLVLCTAVSPDGTCIVSGSSDKTIRIWDAESAQTVREPLTGHEAAVKSVAFSPDGTRIAGLMAQFV